MPENEPDPHTESHERRARSPDGWTILGARVRGKKHKHEGTHCDDWFEFATSGAWSILAVSDGGGSYKFSRVGAKAATTAAVEFLTDKLRDHVIRERDAWTGEAFQEDDLTFPVEMLKEAMGVACNAVRAAVAERLNSQEHHQVLGREPTLRDFYATLLLAVRTTVRYRDADYSVVFGCSVGDGMMATVDREGRTGLLMTPDSGEHSGETRFLEDKEITPDKLRQRVFTHFGRPLALMVMSDGVADDYFPNDPGMSWLFGDLTANGVLPLRLLEPDQETLQKALEGTRLPSLDTAKQAAAPRVFETAGPDGGLRTVRIRSITAFAEKLGKTPEEVVASPALLWLAAQGEPICPEDDPAVRLRIWLDTYQVRGSFDDRTLVVLHQ